MLDHISNIDEFKSPRQVGLVAALDTQLDAALIWTLRRAMGDPDTDTIYQWLMEGAPAGIEVAIEDPRGIFPPEIISITEETDDLDLPDPRQHRNYSSVDGDEEAVPEGRRLINTGFVKQMDNLEDFEGWLGGRPHLSKLGMIAKVKDDKINRRPILDCRESGVNRKKGWQTHTAKNYRCSG